MKTNEPEVSLELRSEILDCILETAVVSRYHLGELLMLLRPGDYPDDRQRAEKLDGEDKDCHGEGGFDLFYHLMDFGKEALRALLIPHLAQAISHKLQVEVAIDWEKRYESSE